jgi:uncharacterized metal-binding protein YceD (DUF177 family)
VNAPEFSRPVRAHEVGGVPRHVAIAAEPAECAALAQRFGWLALDQLTGDFTLRSEAAGIRVTGTVQGHGSHACVISAVPVAFAATESVSLLLAPAAVAGEEVELGSEDLDVEPLTGDVIDLGEIAAQALALGVDPFPRAPDAVPPAGVISEEAARQAASPFAVLKRD